MAAPALAFDRYVDNSGNDNAGANNCAGASVPCKTIAQGISQASPNETVRVGAGTYDETVTLGGGRSLVEDLNFLPGSSDQPPTGGAIIASSSGTAPAIKVAEGDPAGTISGLTIRGGYYSMEVQAGVTVTGNTFDQATETIGGIQYTVNVGTVAGAGVIAPTFQGNTFSDNPTTPADNQTGLFVGRNASPQILSNQFSGYRVAIDVESPNGASQDAPLVEGNSIVSAREGSTFGGQGVFVFDAAPTLRGNSITAPTDGPDADAATDAVEGILIADGAPSVAAGGTLQRNSVFDHLIGVAVNDNSPSTNPVVTLEGDVLGGSTNSGLSVSTSQAGGGSAQVQATNITVFDSPTFDIVFSSGSTSSLTLDSSIVGKAISAPAGNTCSISFSAGPTTGSNCDNFQTTTAPAFVNASTRDYRLQSSGNAALIDMGNPTAPAATVDYNGDARVLDGNGDCVARRDIGADEAAAVAPNCAGAGGSGAVASQSPQAGAGADNTDPSASALAMGGAFPAADSGASITRKGKRKTGTTVSYRLSEAAKVTFSAQRELAGRKVGRRCVKPTGTNRRRRRCKRFKGVGSFLHSGKQGSNSFHFTGRLRGRKLPVGRYRLVAVPTDAAGNKGKAVRRGFRIIR